MNDRKLMDIVSGVNTHGKDMFVPINLCTYVKTVI